MQPPSNYITAPVRSELKQPDFNAPRPNYSGQYVSQSYQQYGFEQFHPSTYVSSGSGLNQRGPPSQVSNANPSIITFQKDNARSALEQPLQFLCLGQGGPVGGGELAEGAVGQAQHHAIMTYNDN